MNKEEFIKSRDNDKSLVFEVNLEGGLFMNTYKNIDERFFDKQYFNLIKNTKNKIEKEFLIFIRKNQHFFSKIKLNNHNIFDAQHLQEEKMNILDALKKLNFFENLTSRIDDILYNNNISNCHNKINRDLSNKGTEPDVQEVSQSSIFLDYFVWPKFKKNEINFAFDKDLMELSFDLSNVEKLYLLILDSINNSNLNNKKKSLEVNHSQYEKKENVNNQLNDININQDLLDVFGLEIVNLKNDSNNSNNNGKIFSNNKFPVDLYQALIKNLKTAFIRHIINYENIFLALNKFTNYLENYFPMVYNKCAEERLRNANIGCNNSTSAEDRETENIDSSSKNSSTTSNFEWSQEEQQRLEEALKLLKDEKETKVKFNKISSYVKTKSAKQCADRYKFLASIFKKESELKAKQEKSKASHINYNNACSDNIPKDSDNTKTTKIDLKTNIINNAKRNLIESKNSQLKETKDGIIILVNENNSNVAKNLNENEKQQQKNQQTPIIDRNINSTSTLTQKNISNNQNENNNIPAHGGLKQENDKALDNISKTISKKKDNESDIIAGLDTLDLVDQLLNQFDMNYSDINLNPQNQDHNANTNLIRISQEGDSDAEEDEYKLHDDLEKSKTKGKRKNQKNSSFSNNELQEENECDYSDLEDDGEKRAENNFYSGAAAKFDKNLNYTFNDKITAENMRDILNVIKFGEKFAVQYSSIKLNRIALAEICEVNFFIKCKKCKSVSFESKFIKISNKINLFYCSTICPKCKAHIILIFKSELIHCQNLAIAGISYSFGAIILDFLTSTFLLNCLNCLDFSKKVKFRSGELSSQRDKTCQNCQAELSLSTQNLQIVPYSSNNYSFLEDLEINFFKSNTQIIDSEGLNEYIKLYERKIKSGSPLPDFGTCKHYHHSYKWFRFDCCCQYFPCDECHNDASNHLAEWAKQVICGYCCFEQSSSNKVCASCGKAFAKDVGGSGFWEGGKGCRNKALMSGKDSHKFKNSTNKTISRKKIKDSKDNKK